MERDKLKWGLLVELVQIAFRDGFLAEEATCQALVLILKGGSEYCVIGLVEVVWKGETVI